MFLARSGESSAAAAWGDGLVGTRVSTSISPPRFLSEDPARVEWTWADHSVRDALCVQGIMTAVGCTRTDAAATLRKDCYRDYHRHGALVVEVIDDVDIRTREITSKYCSPLRFGHRGTHESVHDFIRRCCKKTELLTVEKKELFIKDRQRTLAHYKRILLDKPGSGALLDMISDFELKIAKYQSSYYSINARTPENCYSNIHELIKERARELAQQRCDDFSPSKVYRRVNVSNVSEEKKKALLQVVALQQLEGDIPAP